MGVLRKLLVSWPHSAVRRLGFDIVRYPPPEASRRQLLLSSCGVDLVLDVGANHGQFGSELRRCGYGGRIVSFEPVGAAFAALQKKAQADPLWEVVHTALGREPGRIRMNVAGNSHASSSVLPMLPLHEAAAPHSAYVSTEEVVVVTLEAVMAKYGRGATTPYLKLDVQGYEGAVLDGAGAALERLAGIETEMSLVPLYEGAPLLGAIVSRLGSARFELVGISPEFADPRTGRLLQANGVFLRVQP